MINKNNKYDMVVVGAGPSGAMASKYASMNDMNVLIIEKKKEIGVPIQCAGFIPHFLELKELIPSLNIPIELMNIPSKCIQSKITTQAISFSEFNSIIKSISLNGYIVNRTAFDQNLVEQSCNAGSELQCETKVTSINNNILTTKGIFGGKKIEAKVIVGADGPTSIVKKYIENSKQNMNLNTKKINNKYICFQYKMTNVNIDENEIKIYFSDSFIPGGYAWIFPDGKDQVSVGIGLKLVDIKAKKSIKLYLDNFIQNHPYASKILKFGKVVSIHSGFVPLFNFDSTVFENKILVGDAANHIMATTGGGIPFAMSDGKNAGIIASNNINNGYPLSNYEIQWKKEFGINLKNSVSIKNIVELILSKKKLNFALNLISDLQIKRLQCGIYPKLSDIFNNK